MSNVLIGTSASVLFDAGILLLIHTVGRA